MKIMKNLSAFCLGITCLAIVEGRRQLVRFVEEKMIRILSENTDKGNTVKREI